MNRAEQILATRAELCSQVPRLVQNTEEEGGCGVTGFISSIPVTGKNIFEPSAQMHNRGNGKGGGIAAVGFIAAAMGVSQQVLDEDYMLHIALLGWSATRHRSTGHPYPCRTGSAGGQGPLPIRTTYCRHSARHRAHDTESSRARREK